MGNLEAVWLTGIKDYDVKGQATKKLANLDDTRIRHGKR
jgi:hypothetical protein